ncbi:calcium-binding protein, partial [Campylobacter sp. FMV-PI01]|nr:calcium-binding protein [Campylobacter portucalensis]
MEVIKDTVKFGKDVIQGAWDTVIVAPFKFGMFLGNLSGLAGKQQQLKAELEWEFAKKAALAFWNNTGGARDYIAKEIGDDVKKRPGYYIGSFGAGVFVKSPSTVIKIGEKTIDLKRLKTTAGKMAVYGGKADIILNEMFDKFLDFMSKTYPNNYDPTFPFQEYFKPYTNLYTNPIIYDPLILDLDNDGIETTTLKDGVYFDHNGDGISFKTSWVDKDDALLVLDKNLNNQIDNGNELFGNFTKLNNSTDTDNNSKFAINGFHALKEFDTNKDNIIDNKDDEFNKLLLWQDKNSNALVDKDELFTLEEKGIKSINLNHTISNEVLNSDNTKELISTFTKFDGSSNEIADVNFKVDSRDSIYNKGIFLDEKYANLTNLKGYGFLRDLNEAASLSENLFKTIKEYSNAITKEEQLKLLETLVKEWSNTSGKNNSYSLEKANIINNNMAEIKIINLVDKLNDKTILNKNTIYDEIISLSKEANDDRFKDGKYLVEILKNNNDKLPSSYTTYKTIRVTPSQNRAILSFNEIDGDLLKEFDSIKYKLQIIDNFTGKTTTTLYYNTINDVIDIISNINKAYDEILNYSYKSLLTQTRLKEYINLMELDINETYNLNGEISYEFKLNYDNAISKFKEVNNSNPKKAFTDLAEFITMFESKNDIKDGIALLSNFAITAKEKGVIKEYLDTLSSKTISDLSTQTGTLDDDTLIGTNILDGKDTLYGLDGDDTLIGGVGDDILVGGKGSDTYLYEDSNFGNDIIINDNSSNSVDNSLSNNLNTNSNFLNNTNLNLSNSMDNTLSNKTNHNNPFINDKDIIKFKGNIKKEDIIYKRVMDNGVITNDLIILLKDEYNSLINSPNNTDINHQRNNQSILNNQSYNPNTPIIDKSLLKNTNNSIIIKDFFKDDSSMISAIEFKNSDDIITKDTIINSLLTTSNFNDYINPFDKDKNYKIDSKDGDDTIITHNANDTILAGNGNDTI